MKLNVVRVGNSRGLRLPKRILEEYRITEQVELNLKEGYIELRAIDEPRAGWREDFIRMMADENEEERIPDFFEDEDV